MDSIADPVPVQACRSGKLFGNIERFNRRQGSRDSRHPPPPL
jgi:hypothetical protein